MCWGKKKGCSGQYGCASSSGGKKFDKRFHFGFNGGVHTLADPSRLGIFNGLLRIQAGRRPDKFGLVLLDRGDCSAVSIMRHA